MGLAPGASLAAGDGFNHFSKKSHGDRFYVLVLPRVDGTGGDHGFSKRGDTYMTTFRLR